MRKKYTEESLMKALRPYDEPITTAGYLSQYSHEWDVNYSSILTALIQSAGRYCQNYASDLFIDWFAIAKRLENSDDRYTDGVYEYLFGIRKSGVDGITFILSQANNNDGGYFSEYYEDYAELHKYLLNEFEHPMDGEEPETLTVRQNIRKDMTDKAWSLRKAN